MEASNGRYALGRFRHIALAETGSTNSECMIKARADDPGLLWITAGRQTGGRGRRGRPWVSEPGNLYASLLLIDPAPVAAVGSLPLVVALALYRAVSQEMAWSSDRLSIKWPNDLLIDGKKLSGILIESEKIAEAHQAVVIGCGVNIAHKPDNPLYPAISLQEAGIVTSPETLFARLMQEMAATLELWDEGRGIADIVAAWKQHVHGMGKPIKVNLPDRSISGIFAGIDDNGLLILALSGGDVMHIASGDVFFQ